MKSFIYLLVVALISFACSGKVKSKHEVLYDSVSDSLVKYQDCILQKSDNSMSDFMSLDYDTYKSQYQLTDKEMDQLSKTFEVSYEIAKISKSIRENMELTTDGMDHINSLDSSETDYTFHPEQVSPKK